MRLIVCLPKSLSPDQTQRAFHRSVELNPDNATSITPLTRTPINRRGGPRRLAVVIGRRWPAAGVRLTVQFLDSPKTDLRARILQHMNAWAKTTSISFEETQGEGMVRIARLDSPPDMAGYWSYVGTEILGIEQDRPTLNLEGFTMKTSDAEFRRVVRHEAGHTLGFDHEHMRRELVDKIDKRKAIAYYDRTQGWTAAETMNQVLTPLAARSIMGTTESDPHSIMCYQIPADITKDGKPIPGGLDINPKDYAFAATIYPKKSREVREERSSAVPMSTGHTDSRMAHVSSPQNDVTYAPDDTFHVVIMDDFDGGLDRDTRRLKTGKPMKKERPQFARVLASYAGARVTGAISLNAIPGEATRFSNITKVHERIKRYTNRESGSLPSDEEMMEFGKNLFETLFHGDVRRLYDEARARQQSRRLGFILTSMIPEIADKPWEFAYDSGRKSFLATEEVQFVRNALTAIPTDMTPPLQGPLRILVAAAQPIGFGHLSAKQEADVIYRGFEPLIDAKLATVEVQTHTTPGIIHGRLMSERFDVLHFIGHGTYDETDSSGRLIFENPHGGNLVLDERSVRELFCKRGVRLIFLNACETGRGGSADFNKGLAQALVSHGLPALVANQYSVLDSSATLFAQHFYWTLAQGMGVGEAAREARIAVNYSMQGEVIDWAVPVVYARDPNMTLSVRPDKVVPPPAISVRRENRIEIQRRKVRVAVWDFDNVFPSLRNTLETMNNAQEVFGFALVDLSVPIDAWYLNKREEDGTPYLWAEKLAARLDGATVELHVDILACVTRHWLYGSKTFNLYGWWPDNKKPPVVILSCAGLDLPAEGLDTERAVVNVMVTTLAGFLADVDCHKRGPADCPLYYNEDRELAHIIGRQKFDRICSRKLQEKIPVELPALTAILNAVQPNQREQKKGGMHHVQGAARQKIVP